MTRVRNAANNEVSEEVIGRILDEARSDGLMMPISVYLTGEVYLHVQVRLAYKCFFHSRDPSERWKVFQVTMAFEVRGGTRSTRTLTPPTAMRFA